MNSQGHLDACALKWDVWADSPCLSRRSMPIQNIGGLLGGNALKSSL